MRALHYLFIGVYTSLPLTVSALYYFAICPSLCRPEHYFDIKLHYWGRGGGGEGCNGILCQIMLDLAQSSTAQSRPWQKVLKVHLLPTCTQYHIVPPISRLEIDRSQWSQHMTDVNDDENEFIWLLVLYSAPFSFLLDVVQIVYHCVSVDCQHYFQWLPASKTWNNIFTPDFVPDIHSLYLHIAQFHRYNGIEVIRWAAPYIEENWRGLDHKATQWPAVGGI